MEALTADIVAAPLTVGTADIVVALRIVGAVIPRRMADAAIQRRRIVGVAIPDHRIALDPTAVSVAITAVVALAAADITAVAAGASMEVVAGAASMVVEAEEGTEEAIAKLKPLF